MTNQHPLTPPPELVQQWCLEAEDEHNPKVVNSLVSQLATQAAQWGADQELEACCKWLPKLPPWSGNDLRKHRRPKPPSLKEQALEARRRMWSGASNHDDWDLVRRALEQLPN